MTDEPSAEALIANAANNGWAFFDGPVKADAAAKPPEDKAARLAAIAAAMMMIPEFRELLEFLADKTLRRPTFLSSLGLPMAEVYGQGMFREGQNSVVEMLLKMIAEGRKLQPAPPRQV